MDDVARLKFQRLDECKGGRSLADQRVFTNRVVLMDLLRPIDQRSIGTGISYEDTATIEVQCAMR